MTGVHRQENAKLEKAKGDNALEEAQILAEKEKYDGAVSRAYYAAFHYASACLLTKGLEAHSHQGMQRLFHLHFVRTGIFSEETGVLLSHAQKAREEADYFPEISFTKKIAQERIQEVESFVQQAKQYLSQCGV